MAATAQGPEVVNEFTHCGLIESGGNSGFMQEVLTETLLGTPLSSSLLAARIASLQETYKHRCGVLCNSLNKHLGDVAGVSFVVPEGGYFVWVRLPDSLVRHLRDARIRRAAVSRASA